MKNFFDINVLQIGSHTIEILHIFYVFLILLSTWLGTKILRRGIYGLKLFDEGGKYTLYAITKYIVYTVVLMTSLRLLGIDITVLIASSTALFVGIGLGLKDLFSDFLSGVILLTDGTVKVGNVIQFGEIRVQVIAISFRTSTLKTREGKEIIIPNSYLTKNEVINWSNQKNHNRHNIEITVAARDVTRAQTLMLEAAKSHLKVTFDPEPYVRVERFADWGVELKLLFWSDEVYAVGRMLGDVRFLILESFQKNDITIPYPHYVVTLNNKVSES